MQTFKRLLVVFFLSAPLATTAQATLIVDTGPGPAEDAGFQNVGLSWIQSLAGQFSTTQTWLIESIQGWMSPDEGASTATVAIYSDIGSVPGSALYAAEFLSVGQPHANTIGLQPQFEQLLVASGRFLHRRSHTGVGSKCASTGYSIFTRICATDAW